MQQYDKTLFGDPVIGFGRRAGWITKEVSKPAAHGVALTNAMRSAAMRIRGDFVPSELFALCPFYAVSHKAHGGAIAALLRANVIERVDSVKKVNCEGFEQVYRVCLTSITGG
jgi:hypothetical protein